MYLPIELGKAYSRTRSSKHVNQSWHDAPDAARLKALPWMYSARKVCEREMANIVNVGRVQRDKFRDLHPVSDGITGAIFGQPRKCFLRSLKIAVSKSCVLLEYRCQEHVMTLIEHCW